MRGIHEEGLAMTIVTAGPAKWTWSEDVLAFAREAGVEQHLDELMRATQALFPAAREIRVTSGRTPTPSIQFTEPRKPATNRVRGWTYNS